MNIAPSIWVDLPKDSLEEITGLSGSLLKKMEKKVSDYHNISKSSPKLLSKRISSLSKILDFAVFLQKKDKSLNLHSFSKLSQEKLSHLKRLKKVVYHTLSQTEEYHKDLSNLNFHKWQPLTMCNKRMFSCTMKEYWGQHWLETLDPCHRRLTEYFKRWEQLKNPPPFLFWIEEQHLPPYIPQVNYLSIKEREKFKVTIIKNQPLQNNIPLKNERGIYAIDLDETVYFSKKEQTLWHSSFTCGKPVLGAGTLEFRDGVVTFIAFDSGHYQPSFEEGVQSIKILHEKGFFFDQIIKIQFYKDGTKITLELPFNDFDKSLNALELAQLAKKRPLTRK